MTYTKTWEHTSRWNDDKRLLRRIAPFDLTITGHYEEETEPYDGSIESFLKVYMTSHTKYETLSFKEGEEISLPDYWDNKVELSCTESFSHTYDDEEDDEFVF